MNESLKCIANVPSSLVELSFFYLLTNKPAIYMEPAWKMPTKFWKNRRSEFASEGLPRRQLMWNALWDINKGPTPPSSQETMCSRLWLNKEKRKSSSPPSTPNHYQKNIPEKQWFKYQTMINVAWDLKKTQVGDKESKILLEWNLALERLRDLNTGGWASRGARFWREN